MTPAPQPVPVPLCPTASPARTAQHPPSPHTSGPATCALQLATQPGATPTLSTKKAASTHHLSKLLALQAEVDAAVAVQQPGRKLLRQLQRSVNVACLHPLADALPHLRCNTRSVGQGQEVSMSSM